MCSMVKNMGRTSVESVLHIPLTFLRPRLRLGNKTKLHVWPLERNFLFDFRGEGRNMFSYLCLRNMLSFTGYDNLSSHYILGYVPHKCVHKPFRNQHDI